MAQLIFKCALCGRSRHQSRLKPVGRRLGGLPQAWICTASAQCKIARRKAWQKPKKPIDD